MYIFDLAEVLWTSQEEQSWDDFEKRMSTHYNRLDEAGIGYRVPQPKLIEKNRVEGGYIIKLENVVDGAHIRYTTDGVWPNVYSTVYTEPVKVKHLQDFMAITVVNRHQYSLPLYFPMDYSKYKNYGKLLKEIKPVDFPVEEFGVVEMNASGKINKNKRYEVSFWMTDGEGEIAVESVELYKNGKLIATDKHKGIAGKENKDNIYMFDVSQYETGAGFTLKAKLKAITKDVYGVVFIK